jgi:hypothetical protein
MTSELDRLRDDLAALQRRLTELEADATASRGGPATTRRHLFTLGAGAAAGTLLAGAAGSQPVAATDGDPMFVGWTHQSTLGTTIMTGTEPQQVGAPMSGGAPALTVRATGLPPESVPRALLATADAGTAVEAAASNGVGLVARGGVGSLMIGGGVDGPQPPPALRDTAAEAGLVDIDVNGDVWLCVATGTPGVWRKVAGMTSAGAFHPIAPARVYDSRLSAAGVLAPNTNRVISVAAGIAAGGATATDVVPPGATAIAFNLTAASPSGPNFLSVVPGDQAGFSTSTVNFPGGFDCANGSVVGLDDNRQIRLFCGDQSGGTHAIVDVTGYYR